MRTPKELIRYQQVQSKTLLAGLEKHDTPENSQLAKYTKGRISGLTAALDALTSISELRCLVCEAEFTIERWRSNRVVGGNGVVYCPACRAIVFGVEVDEQTRQETRQ